MHQQLVQEIVNSSKAQHQLEDILSNLEEGVVVIDEKKDKVVYINEPCNNLTSSSGG
jgi:transcriptional regulator with PAS, ATPase and Fis domain